MAAADPMADRVAGLSGSKRLLLERWLGGAAGDAVPQEIEAAAPGPDRLPRVVPAPRERFLPFPLTDLQQAYWVGRNIFFELGGVAAHSYLELEAPGLDLARLELALRRLIERHEMLRAVVDADGRQRILPAVPSYRVAVSDLRGLEPQAAAAELAATRQRLSHQVLPAHRWPLFQVVASRLAGERTRLHVGFDILIADVRSVRILTRDLAALYSRPEAPLAPLELSFRDYVMAERSLRDAADYRRAKDYWLARLPTLPPAPELPRAGAAAAPPRGAGRGAAQGGQPRFVRRAGRLDAGAWRRLEAMAARSSLTPANALLAAFAEVLARWAASPRFTLNLTLYNRLPLHPQVDQIVGDFTSLTLLAVDASEREPFAVRAQALQRQLWADLDQRLFNGVEVLRELARRGGDRLRAAMPVVFTCNLGQDGGEPGAGAGLGELAYSISQTPQVWLDQQVAEEAGALVFHWDAVEDLFPDGLLDEMFDAYRDLLDRLAGEESAWHELPPMPRRAAAAAAGQLREPRRPRRAGRSPAAPRVAEILAGLLSRDAIPADGDLLALGVTSIDLIRAANELEREFAIRPDMELFFAARNVTEIAALYEPAALDDAELHRGEPPPAAASAPLALVLDPAEREAFKRRRPGLRTDVDRQPAFDLQEPAAVRGTLAGPAARRSHRRFLLDPIALESLSGLLACLRQTTLSGEPKHWYASAGGLYPVQTYLHCKPGRIDGLPPGTYYYHPGAHRLVQLAAGVQLDRGVHAWMNRAVFDQAAFSLFLVAEERAIRPMYGNLARDFSMYEAGSMGQLLMMVAPSYGLGLCGIGRVDLEESRRWFGWDESNVVLHTLLGGRIDAEPPVDEDAEGVDLSRSPILPQPRDGTPLPVSFAQERLWFLQQLEPAIPLFNVPQALRVRGRLRRAALPLALAEITRRHEVLRSAFLVVEERLAQTVAPVLPFHLPVVDLASIPAAARAVEAQRWARREACRRFDLERGPLLRCLLLHLAEEEHILLLVVHHIVADGWSGGILVRELVEGYEAFSDGRSPALPELPIQYADYAAWQRRVLAGDALEAQLAYWRRQLADPLPALELPTSRERQAAHAFDGATAPLAVAETESAALREVCRREGVTLFIALLAIFKTLLWRYTGEQDVLVGSPFANRNRQELEGLIGFFANTLVLRSSLGGDPTFRELLARVRKVVLGAHAHSELPFDKLVRELNPQRDLRRTPFFQVWFALQHAGMPALSLPSLELKPIEISTGTAQFDLMLELRSTARGLDGRFEYNRALFSADAIARAAGHYAALLDGVLADPGCRLSDLPLLGEGERHQLLVEANEPGRRAPSSATIQELFARQVQRTPASPAVLWGSSRLDFRELDRRANQVARHLRRLGVGPESLVAVYLEPSPEVALALLGVLKAGAAFLPLDAPLPSARLASLLDAAAVPVLLTQAGLRDQVPASARAVVCLDADWPDLAREESSDPGVRVGADGLAYAFFTSGSTGRPKAVLVPQRALVNYAAAMAEELALAPGERVLQLAPLGFDVLVEEVLPAWLSGAGVVFRDGRQPLSGAEVLRLAAAAEATLLEVPTVLWHQMIEELSGGCRPPASLRRVIVGCGKVGRDQLARWQHTEIPLLLVYGLTELAVTSTLCRPAVRGDQAGGGPSLPLGQPLAHTRIYLLDAWLRPVPAGVRGEIHVAGEGLARGYLGDPASTAARFVPDPFTHRPGLRMFRTGDVARHAADGSLHFLGRIDSQVKVRGCRIELGEIEAVLAEHPGVRQAAARVWGEAPEDQRIAAYVAVARGRDVEAVELRGFLRSRLPSFMCPATFVFLPALPENAHGKLDRKALPEPARARREESGGFVPPRTPAEARLASLAAELLGLAQVSVLDDFFDLGGHSLLATQLASRVERAFRVKLPLRLVFEEPTVAGLAQALGGLPAVEAGAAADGEAARWAAEPIARRPAGIDAPLSFAQERLWILHRLDPSSPAYNLPAPVRLAGHLNVAVLAGSLARAIQRHEVLRTTFQVTGGRPVQAVAAAPPRRLPIVDLESLQGAARQREVSRLAAADARRVFDLQRGPLLRAALVRTAPRDHVLLLTLHHIVADGWSMTILLRELAELYAAGATGRAPELAELAIQYADFALWQRRRLEGRFLASQLAYWHERLQGAPPGVELPGDRPRSASQTSRGAAFGLRLAAPLAASLKILGQEEAATPFMTLLAAFQALLARHTGSQDLVIGSTIANRNRVETEPLVGFFVNTLVLRTPLSGGIGFRLLLARVREATLGAYTHQDLPFEILVEHLKPVRDPSRNPLFQLMFSFDVAVIVEHRLPGLVLTPLGVHPGATQFDLTLDLSDRPPGIVGSLTYSTDLFDRTTIARLAGHFQVLLDGVVAEPDQPLADLPLLTAPELHQLLVEWNDTGPPRGDGNGLLDELFTAQAARTPDAPALLGRGAGLSYRQLDARANQLARRLRSLGVGPEVLVGLATDRSVAMAVGLLGILKAGGACLPLEPGLPRERLAFLLADSRVGALLTQEQFAGRLPPAAVPTLLLDAQRDAIARQSHESPARTAQPENLAYATYTSGSTGMPKGVLLTHAALAGYARDMAARCGLGPGDRVLQLAPLSFDVVLEELLPAWASGAAVVLDALPAPASSLELAEAIEREEVTVIELAAAYWQQWVRDLSRRGRRPPASLRLVIVGCEPPAPAALRLWRGFQLPLIHVFGLTEATVTSTLFELPAGAALEEHRLSSVLPIGRPVAAVRAYVLDADGRPVPIGVPGELHLGGSGLARGYLDRPELTAERFVPNPWSGEPGARLYRTGDRVRWRAEGVLEFLGRLDQQVKVRGFRIEVAEVEAALRRHPAVLEAAVAAVDPPGAPGNRRLAAYLQLREEEPPTVGGLRRFLADELPAYMIPSLFVTLAQIPLTAHGKVDRERLPLLPELGAAAPEPAPAQGTALERALVELWREMLGVPRVALDDNFFELGGDSMLSIQIAARGRELGIALTPRDIFEHQTIAELATVASAGGGTAATGSDPAAPTPPRAAHLPAMRGGFTPADFPKARLSQGDLDRFIAGITDGS